MLAKVRHYILTGWPSGCSPEIMPFYSRKDELSVEGGCILWGCRVVVPPKKREQIMAELHDTHPGITLMKAVARRLVWCPGLDTDLKKMVNFCESCQESRNVPPKGRTIRKVMGGGGGGNTKKNSCKGKCQEKKFTQRRR